MPRVLRQPISRLLVVSEKVGLMLDVSRRYLFVRDWIPEESCPVRAPFVPNPIVHAQNLQGYWN